MSIANFIYCVQRQIILWCTAFYAEVGGKLYTIVVASYCDEICRVNEAIRSCLAGNYIRQVTEWWVPPFRLMLFDDLQIDLIWSILDIELNIILISSDRKKEMRKICCELNKKWSNKVKATSKKVDKNVNSDYTDWKYWWIPWLYYADTCNLYVLFALIFWIGYWEPYHLYCNVNITHSLEQFPRFINHLCLSPLSICVSFSSLCS